MFRVLKARVTASLRAHGRRGIAVWHCAVEREEMKGMVEGAGTAWGVILIVRELCNERAVLRLFG